MIMLEPISLIWALSDGKHRDHGGYADNDTQHREEAAQFVIGECPDSYFY